MKPPALPPTAHERDQARLAVAALRAAIATPSVMGQRQVMHLDMGRPRRGVTYVTWTNLPGFLKRIGKPPAYEHRLLPGWEYARDEIVAEMIPDLEALAEKGVRPTAATTTTGAKP
jgi:hypothetical protein